MREERRKGEGVRKGRKEEAGGLENVEYKIGIGRPFCPLVYMNLIGHLCI